MKSIFDAGDAPFFVEWKRFLVRFVSIDVSPMQPEPETYAFAVREPSHFVHVERRRSRV